MGEFTSLIAADAARRETGADVAWEIAFDPKTKTYVLWRTETKRFIGWSRGKQVWK